MVGDGGRYGGDHLNFQGAKFKGPFFAQAHVHQRAAAPTAMAALPARVPGFTGRKDELNRLLDAFDPCAEGGGSQSAPVLVAAVSGLGGIGKTALAVQAAHEACEKGWFPGGVLFLDLHGYDDDPVAGKQALEALLRALGAEPERIPVRADDSGALYRSMLAERGRERGAVLVLADNASSPDQVRPLLPGDPRHRLLVTSRSKLPQLGARLLALDELTPGEAYALLDRALRIADPGDSRVPDESEAAMRLASRCGHLPLALQIAAALLVLDREKPVVELADELSELRSRLDHLDDGERSVRAAFDLSYRRLPGEQARLLRLLALAPGPDAGTEVVTALVGAKSPPTRALEALTRTHLVERGSARGRWRLHDLVRAFGLQVVAEDAGLVEEGEAARERVLNHYTVAASAAAARLRWLPGNPRPARFATRAEALVWLDAERTGLVEAVRGASEERLEEVGMRLSGYLADYLDWRRYFDDWITVARAAERAAHRTGDPQNLVIAWNNLGNALQKAGRIEEAIDTLARACGLLHAVGDDREGIAWTNLGMALHEAGRLEEAIAAHSHACALCAAAGGPREGMAWNNLGLALRDVGRVDEAIEAHIRARALYQAAGDRYREATAWNNLGIALWKAARPAEAVEVFGVALVLKREFEDWYGMGNTFDNLARAHVDAGDFITARAVYLQAADAFTRADALIEAARSRAYADVLTP